MMNQRRSHKQLASQSTLKDKEKTPLHKVNTHCILTNYNLLQSIKEYDRSTHKTTANRKGLTRAQTSAVTATSNAEMQLHRNMNQMRMRNSKHKANQLCSSGHLQRVLSKDKPQSNTKYKTIDNQLQLVKVGEQQQIISKRIEKQFSIICNNRLQSHRQFDRAQDKIIVKSTNKFEQFEPIQRKLKIFRQKFKLSQNLNKKRQDNDQQHQEIERIIQSLQQQNNINTNNMIQNEDIISTKQDLRCQGLESEFLNGNKQGLHRNTRGTNPKYLHKDNQQSNVKLQYQRSLLKLAFKEKTQLNLDYLMRKPLLKGRYQIMQKIGRGLSGQVFKAKDILSDRLVAVKVIINNFKEEQYSFYKQNQHKNIVSYYNNFVQHNTRYLILEYFPHTLQSYVKAFKLTQPQIKAVFRNIVGGLSFLHAMSIAHRDIKLNNIVVSQQLQTVKFIDFGLCIDIAQCHQQMTREFCGTVKYMPPQILQKRQYNPRKADIWSLGVVLYYLLHKRYPYNGRSEFDMLQKINKCKLLLDGGLNSDLKQLLKGMLNKRPIERLTIIQILQSKWING